ncbi:hypothetical protein P7C73_g1541, partial [Tremellales sp. Uapishka_1]
MHAAALTAVLFSLVAFAAPTPRSSAPTDTEILQYALTLENLENDFYHGGLSKFSAEDFKNAGFPSWVRDRMAQIGEHEAQHVALLSGALGTAAPAPCQYSFPYTDPKSFVTLSSVLESVGVSAYLGAAASINEKAYLTVAGSILTTEARHQGWVSSAALEGPGWSGPEDTPLDFNEVTASSSSISYADAPQVYSLATQFITSCPASNPPLPFKAFPTLAVASDGTLTYSGSADGQYLLIVAGLTSKTFPITNGKVTLPSDIQGFAYGVVTSQQDATMVSDDNIIAGPAILDYPFNSKVGNPAAAL